MSLLQGVGTSIAALVLKPWFVCSAGADELSFGLQKLKATLPSIGISGEDDVCGDAAKFLLGDNDVPCNIGKLALGLGAAAAAVIGVAMLLGAFIAATRRLGWMWGAALAANLFGGALAIASGAIYVGLMVKETDGSSSCKPAQAAPILMVAGEFQSPRRCQTWRRCRIPQHERAAGCPTCLNHSLTFVCLCGPLLLLRCVRACSCSGGVLSVFASCLYCTCCCRPASSTSRVEQVPMQQWQATPQY